MAMYATFIVAATLVTPSLGGITPWQQAPVSLGNAPLSRSLLAPLRTSPFGGATSWFQRPLEPVNARPREKQWFEKPVDGYGPEKKGPNYSIRNMNPPTRVNPPRRKPPRPPNLKEQVRRKEQSKADRVRMAKKMEAGEAAAPATSALATDNASVWSQDGVLNLMAVAGGAVGALVAAAVALRRRAHVAPPEPLLG